MSNQVSPDVTPAKPSTSKAGPAPPAALPSQLPSPYSSAHGGGGAGGGGGGSGGGKRRGGLRSRAGAWDEVKLWQMGYRQEVKREFTLLNNLATCTSVLSFFALVDTYGSQGLAYGGPVSVVWGWALCSVASLAVALCLAELLSAYPTSGGIYYWSWALAPPRYRTLICWLAGWLNLLGQVAFTAGLEFALARGVAAMVYLHTAAAAASGASALGGGGGSGGGGGLGLSGGLYSGGGGAAGGAGVRLSNGAVMGIMLLMFVLHVLLNIVSPAFTAWLNTVSLAWHVLAGLGLCAALLGVAARLNPPGWVFGAWTPNTDVHGIRSPAYIFLMGLLMSSWTIMGYDASIHMVEETIDAENAGSAALVGSVAACAGLGGALLLSLTFALQSVTSLLSADNATGGHSAMLQVLWDVFRSRYGSGAGALGLAYIPLVGLFFCASSSITANARMLYAFSRDGAMPGFRLWRRLSPRSRLPVAATLLMATLAAALSVPCCFNAKFFDTVSAGSVVALSLSYGIPIFLRLLRGRHAFIPGPFSLGRASRPLAVLSCAWIGLTSVVFVLPTTYPVTAHSANYTAPLLAGVLAAAAGLFYAPRWGGRHWFTGPAPNVE